MSLPDALPVPSSVPERANEGRASRRSARRMSLRVRVLGVVLAINAVAALVAGLVVVRNARIAAEREMRASVEMAVRMAREMAERMAEDPARSLTPDWPAHLRHLRHVRISIEDAQGQPVPLPRAEIPDEDSDEAPAWFARLIGVGEVAREVEIRAEGALVGRVRIAGVPDDEVAEVWEDVSDFATVALAVNGALLLALFLALGRMRTDLVRFRSALGELERNRLNCRVSLPRTRELADIAERFNALAEALAATRAENERLTARLVTLQEDERRQIARELHDELGPLMFGLKAGAESLARAAAAGSDATTSRIGERASGMVAIVERMQATNRALLRRIRPAALDHLSLREALRSLVADFRQHDASRTYVLDVGPLADRYGDARDATVYRCAQEAITNALKHGDAHTVRIEVEEAATLDGKALRLVVSDDGSGPPERSAEGLGLAGMRERVRALGGTCHLERGAKGGARFRAELPVPPAAEGPPQ